MTYKLKTCGTLSVLLSALASLQALAAFTVDDGALPEIGEWCGDFVSATNAAVAEGRPLVMVWSKDKCTYCETLEADLVTEAFVEWRKEQPYFFCFVKGSEDGADVGKNAGTGARDFAQHTGGVLAGTPSVCLWHPYGGGGVTATNFYGRTGRMLVSATSGDGTRKTVGEQLMESVDAFFADFRTPFSFVVSGAAKDRLEAEESTVFVDVPLARKGSASTSVGNGRLVAQFPNGVETTNEVVWAAGVTGMSVRVSLTNAGYVAVDGDTIALSYRDCDGSAVLYSSISCVSARANFVTNPHWLGERTADTLGYGEFTFDYDVATQKVAQARAGGSTAYTLAVWSGVLWCPYCLGMETNLFMRTGAGGTSETPFADWARANNVVLPLFDQGRARLDASGPAGGRDCPRLLSYTPDPNKSGANAVSGASYMSRHGVDPALAQYVKDRTAHYSTDLWLAPEATAVRMSQPNLLLVSAAEKVVGRFAGFRTGFVYDKDENIGRLNDLLLLADREDESSDYMSTTRLELEVGGSAVSTTLQINDRQDFYRLSGVRAGRMSFMVTNAVPCPVRLDYYRDGVLAATGTDSLTFETRREDIMATNTFLKVSSYANASQRYFVNGLTTTVFRAEISSAFEPMPGSISFVSRSARVMETAGTVAFSVTRSGGTTGEVRVRVMLDGSSTAVNGERFSWRNTEIVWADGEQGVKTVEIPLIGTPHTFEGEQLATFYLDGVGGCAASVSRAVYDLTIFDTDDPCFETTSVAMDVIGDFASEAILPICNVGSGSSVTLERMSGALPSGISIAYDPETQTVRLSGTATKPGIYTASYVVSESRGGTAVTGWETTFTVTVADPREVNRFYGKAQTVVLDVAGVGDSKRIVGQLTVSLTSRRRLTAKYTGLGCRALSFAGEWGDMDPDRATLSAELARGDRTLSLSLSADGTLSAVLDGELSGSLDIAAPAPNAAWYQGLYTVTLPVVRTGAGPVSAPLGTGYATLRLSGSSALKTGRFQYAGRLPDGTAFSGSDTLRADSLNPDGFARLTMLKVTARDAISVPMRMEAHGCELYSDENLVRVVLAPADMEAFWSHFGNTWSHEGSMAVYGGWYNPRLSPLDLMALFDFSPLVSLEIDADGAAASERHGEVMSVDSAVLEAGPRRFNIRARVGRVSFSCAMGTGVFSGSAGITFANGRRITGSIRGVLLPGWLDCGCGDELVVRPFGSGMLVFKDTIGGRSVTRSLPVNLVNIQE